MDYLAGSGGLPTPETLSGNIENLVGFAQVPVGVIGPLRINGTEARGDFFIPMATTEGALVASFHRGAYAISHSGGASVMCLTEAISRAPCFVFNSTLDACVFLEFALKAAPAFQPLISQTSRHCKFMDLRSSLVGRNLFLGFEYQTGDASGQNMVTIATSIICEYLVEKSPLKPVQWYIEGNMSGDKKATMLAFLSARGKKVTAEVVIPASLLQRFIHVTPLQMVRYGHVAFLGGCQSGSIGVQGHYANALAAIFIACGQDAACVSEAAVGLTDMDVTEQGDLYASVTLPNMIVGTVGGGTHLPTARECLAMLGCQGKDCARKFAESAPRPSSRVRYPSWGPWPRASLPAHTPNTAESANRYPRQRPSANRPLVIQKKRAVTKPHHATTAAPARTRRRLNPKGASEPSDT